MVNAIVAVDLKNGISRKGEIPWHFKEDMKFFAKTTEGGVCIMGRGTYEYIKSKTGKMLPNRDVIVVSNTISFKPDDATKYSSVYAALVNAVATGKTVWVCGGSGIYQEALPYCNSVIITQIPTLGECDSFFPVSYVKEMLQLASKIQLSERVVAYRYKTDTPKPI